MRLISKTTLPIVFAAKPFPVIVILVPMGPLVELKIMLGPAVAGTGGALRDQAYHAASCV